MNANLQFTIYNVKWLVCSGGWLDLIDSNARLSSLDLRSFGRSIEQRSSASAYRALDRIQRESTWRAARAVDHHTGLLLHRL